jgi:hypothetical protein
MIGDINFLGMVGWMNRWISNPIENSLRKGTLFLYISSLYSASSSIWSSFSSIEAETSSELEAVF